MRRLQTETHFRLALFSLQGSDGYVETLLEIAREQDLIPRPATPVQHPQLWLSPETRRRARPQAVKLH